MLQLTMYRPATPPPSFTLPAGFSIRSIHADEGADWCRCCDNGQLGIDEISQAFFNGKMLADPNLPLENILVTVDENGRIAGTASGLVKAESDPNTCGMGGLHMVGVDSAYRGKGLAKPLCAAVVAMLWKQQIQTSRLTTDDFRIPAVKAYLNCGYLPIIFDESHMDRWAAVLQKCRVASVPCVSPKYDPLGCPVLAAK